MGYRLRRGQRSVVPWWWLLAAVVGGVAACAQPVKRRTDAGADAPDVESQADATDDGPVAKTAAPACTSAADCPQAKSVCQLPVCADGVCAMTLLEAGACDDGSACTGDDHCEGGACQPGAALVCDDGNACTVDACAKATGCTATPSTVPCQGDADACTAETCQQGACVAAGIAPACECATAAHCNDPQLNPLFDGNLCSGQWKCDRSVAAKGTCGLDKALAVQCSPPPNVAVGDKECTVAACNPKTGLCEVQVKPDAMPCKDALECTLVTHCQQGKCVPTANGNGCDCIGGTDAECAAWKQKTIDFGVASACTGLAFCIAATRMCALDEASVVKCSTANDGPCAATSCAPATGTCVKAATNEGKVCNDGNPCTANDLCAKGKCQVGKVNLCPCGVDTDCAKHEDGDLCNGTLICDTAGKVCNLKPGTVVACTGGLDSVCAVTACVPTTGQCAVLPIEAVQPKDPKCNPKVKQCAWLAKPAGSAAADPVLCGGSDPCSGGFVCQGGQCKPGDAVVVCKCKSDAECQDDGNLCNGKPTCNLDSGQCEVQPKSVVKCASSAECFKLACQPSTGKCVAKPEPDGQACSDNNSCTGDDSCAQGKCVGGTLLCLCDTDADCKKLDDGNPCNGTLFCDLAKAKPDCQIDKATVVLCPVSPHETTCLKNQCHPPTGTCTLKPTHNYQYCDDDNACTKWEVCVAGQCYSPDNDCPCQADADCATKDDKNACNGTLFCAGAGGKGVCATKAKSAVNCLAGAGTCAVSACNPATGSCAPAAAPNGASCDDGDPCTKYDECMDGKCSPGPAQCKCKSTPDCAEYEDESKCTAPLVCGANQSCTPDLQWLAPKCAIGDACLSQACSPKTGACVTSANDTACEDGNPCTLDLCAPDGACKHSALDGDACGPKLVCKAGTCAAP